MSGVLSLLSDLLSEYLIGFTSGLDSSNTLLYNYSTSLIIFPLIFIGGLIIGFLFRIFDIISRGV